jgi:hypothetical protein
MLHKFIPSLSLALDFRAPADPPSLPAFVHHGGRVAEYLYNRRITHVIVANRRANHAQLRPTRNEEALPQSRRRARELTSSQVQVESTTSFPQVRIP